MVVAERYLKEKMSPFTKGGVLERENSPFKVACLRGDYKTAKKMLDFVKEMEDGDRKRILLDKLGEVLKGPYSKVTGRNKKPAASILLHCVLQGSRCRDKMSKLLLENGALKYINEVGEFNRTAIYYAYGENNKTRVIDSLARLINHIVLGQSNRVRAKQQNKSVKDFISEISHCKNSQERLAVTESYLEEKMSPFTKGGVLERANSPFKVVCLRGDYKTAKRMLDFVKGMENGDRKRILLDELDEVLRGPYSMGTGRNRRPAESTLLHCVLQGSRCRDKMSKLLLENGALRYINMVDEFNKTIPSLSSRYSLN